MKNIKDILNETDVAKDTPTLPKGHRAEFLDKLNTTEGIPSQKTVFHYWKTMAAACVLLLGLGIVINLNSSDVTTQESSLFVEMKSIEDQYLQNIAKEWESFQMTANDAYLVDKYKERLENLDASYQELREEFLIQKNNLTTLEKMIQNLQKRLTLLQEIQQHLKRLKDEQNTL